PGRKWGRPGRQPPRRAPPRPPLRAAPAPPAPRAATRPTISWPGTIGSLGFGSSPSTTCRSVRQTPQAATSSRISPDPGSGADRSRMTSGVRGLSSTMARMTHLQSRERRRRPRQQYYSESHVLCVAWSSPMRLVGDFLEHLGQVCGFVVDDLVELLRRVGHADDELRRELRLDLGRLDDLDDVAIDLLDDWTRHARRRHQAEPGIVDVIQAGLPERWDVRHLRDAL